MLELNCSPGGGGWTYVVAADLTASNSVCGDHCEYAFGDELMGLKYEASQLNDAGR